MIAIDVGAQVCRLGADKDRHCVFFIRISVIQSSISTSALPKRIENRR